MPKLTTRVQLTRLIDAAAAIAKEQSVESVVSLYSQLGLFPITDSPEHKTSDKHKIFDKAELHKHILAGDIGEINTQLETKGLNTAESWSGALVRGLIQQQNLLHPKKNAGAEGRMKAMESLWLSHQLQQSQEKTGSLPPFALYHLALLLQNETAAKTLTSKKASMLNDIFNSMAHDQAPLDPAIKTKIKKLQQGKASYKTLQSIGHELEQAACVGGHLIAAMTSGQKSQNAAKAAKGPNKNATSQNKKRIAAQNFAAAYELAHKHLKEPAIQAETSLKTALTETAQLARTKLETLNTPSATLLMLAIETNIAEDRAKATAKTGLLNGLGKADMSAYFAELVKVLASLAGHWGRIDPDNKTVRVDFWVSTLFNFAADKIGQFRQAASLTSLAELYHLASTDTQNTQIDTLQKLADEISKKDVQAGPAIAGKGAMELAVISATSPALQAILDSTIHHQFTANAINRLLTRVAVPGSVIADEQVQPSGPTIVVDGIEQSFAQTLAGLFFSEGKGKPTKNKGGFMSRKQEGATFDAKKIQDAANKIANHLAKAMADKLYVLYQANPATDNSAIPQNIFDEVIDEQINSLRAMYDSVYDPARDAAKGASQQSSNRLSSEQAKAAKAKSGVSNINAQLKQALATYVTTLLPLVKADLANDTNTDRKTLEGQLFQAMNDARNTSTTTFRQSNARWRLNVQSANKGQQQRAVFQGAVQALTQLFKAATNPLDGERIANLTEHLEPLLHQFQTRIDALNTPKTFIAIAESILILHQHDKTRSAYYASQLLRVIKPEHVPAYHQLSTADAETLTRFANLAYIINKRTGDKYREEIGEPVANLLEEAVTADESAASTGLSLYQWTKDSTVIDELRTAYTEREAKKQAYNAAEAEVTAEQNQVLASRQAEYSSLDELPRNEKIVAIRKEVRASHKEKLHELDAERQAAHTAYVNLSRTLATTVSDAMAESRYQEDLTSSDLNIHTLIDESLARVIARVADMAKAALPVPTNDEHEAAIQARLDRIRGSADQAGENIEGLNCDEIREHLKNLKQAELALDDARAAIRREAGFNPKLEREQLAEPIKLVRQWKREAELPVRTYVYEQTQKLEDSRARIAPSLAEQHYAELPDLAPSLHSTAFDMMKTAPSVRTNHHAAANFNGLALAESSPPASLEKIWPAFLFMDPSVIYGEQLLQGGIIDERVTALLDSNLAPAMRIIMLSALTASISAQAQSDDAEDMLNIWLLSTAIAAVIAKEDQQGRTRLETHSGEHGAQHLLADNPNAFSLQSTAAYHELNAVISNLWGRLALTIPPIVVRKNLDRLYKKELETAAGNAAQRIKKIGAKQTSPMTAFIQKPLTTKPQALLSILRDLLDQLTPIDKSNARMLPTMKAELEKAIKVAATKKTGMTRTEKTEERARISTIKRAAVKSLLQKLGELGALNDRKPGSAIKSIAALYLAQTANFGQRTAFEQHLPAELISTLVKLGKKLGDVQTSLQTEETTDAMTMILRALTFKQLHAPAGAHDDAAQAGPGSAEEESSSDEEEDWDDSDDDNADDDDDASAGAGSSNSGSSNSLNQFAGSVEQGLHDGTSAEDGAAPAADVLDAMHTAHAIFDDNRLPVDYSPNDPSISPTDKVQAWLEQVVLQRPYYATPESYLSLINDSQTVVNNAEAMLWNLIGEALPENYRDVLESTEHVGEFLEKFIAWLSTKVDEAGFATSPEAALALVIHLAHWGHEGDHGNQSAKQFMTLNAMLLSAGISLPKTAAETEAAGAFDDDSKADDLFGSESDDDEQLAVGDADTTVQPPPLPGEPKPAFAHGSSDDEHHSDSDNGASAPLASAYPPPPAQPAPPPPPPMPDMQPPAVKEEQSSMATKKAILAGMFGDSASAAAPAAPPTSKPSASSATKLGGGDASEARGGLLAAIRARGERNDNSDTGIDPRGVAPDTVRFGS